jgi:isochorismate synthase EntC
VLIRIRDAELETMALAGTRPRGEEAELFASEKDRREQSFVTEAIRTALAPVATSIEHPPVPQIERQRGVLHLRTPIRATLMPGTHPLEVAARLHPTPAVAGVPLDAALRAIGTEERTPRGWYAGPLGWLGRRDAVLAVGLRSALLRGSEAFLFAGAGIVEGSEPESEWRETALKMTTVDRALRAEIAR